MLRNLSLTLCLFPVLVTLAGACDSGAACPDGLERRGGVCVPASDSGNSAADASADSGASDAMSDARSRDASVPKEDPGPCPQGCTGERPHCDTNSNKCVECVSNAQCDSDKCVDNKCIECLNNSDCTGVARAKCDTSTNKCVPCTNNSHCDSVPSDKRVCSAGRCAQCDSTNDVACNGKVCDDTTKKCTNLDKGSAARCEPCVATTQCSSGVCSRTAFSATEIVCQDLPDPNCDGLDQSYFVEATNTTVEGVSTAMCTLRATNCEDVEAAGRSCNTNACPSASTCVFHPQERYCMPNCTNSSDCGLGFCTNANHCM